MSESDEPAINTIEVGGIPPLLQLLTKDYAEYVNIQTEAAWCMINLFGASSQIVA